LKNNKQATTYPSRLTMCRLQPQIMAATMVVGKIKATCLLPKKPNFQAIST